ncbi:MAG: response regulator [Leptospiraceae bacterium]|nr:response regulator [Leptospiraceae bacterium]MCP5512369.1 response regulator [Leptospiraceae bacterium]
MKNQEQTLNQMNFDKVFLFSILALFIIFTSLMTSLFLSSNNLYREKLFSFHLNTLVQINENKNLENELRLTKSGIRLEEKSKDSKLKKEVFESKILSSICDSKNIPLSDSKERNSHCLEYLSHLSPDSQLQDTKIYRSENDLYIISQIPESSEFLVTFIGIKSFYIYLINELYLYPLNSIFFITMILFFFRKYFQISNSSILENIEERLKAEKAHREKSLFIANVNHEIRNPLNNIISSVELLKKNKSNPKELDRYIKILSGSSNHLISLVNNVLNLSKIESREISIESIPFNLYELIDEVSLSFEATAGDKNIDFRIIYGDTFPNHFSGDPTKIRQIIYNLLSNSFKFTSEGRIVLELRWKDEEKDTLLISVMDTGKGISKDKISKIFRPFQQEDSSITRKFGGTGLGLSIVHNLIQLMQGNIKISSELGKGTQIEIDLPLEPCRDWKSENCEVAYCSKCITNPNLIDDKIEFNQKLLNSKILVIENEEINLLLLKEILIGYKFKNVTVSQSAEEALTLYEEMGHNIILTDLNLPGKSGIELSRIIRGSSSFPQPLLIAITGDSEETTIQNCLKEGIDFVLKKPYRAKDIYDILTSDFKDNHYDLNSGSTSSN